METETATLAQVTEILGKTGTIIILSGRGPIKFCFFLQDLEEVSLRSEFNWSVVEINPDI